MAQFGYSRRPKPKQNLKLIKYSCVEDFERIQNECIDSSQDRSAKDMFRCS